MKPIIIFGTGRSGTTICHDMFTCHPDVAWLSSLCDSKPDKPYLNRWLMHAQDLGFVGELCKKRSAPSEAYPLWERSCRGFTNPCRDLVAADVTPPAAKRIRETFAQMVTSRRSRLVIKITGWPRLTYIKEIFPDALFISLDRSPFAVASSLLETEWWDGWRGPTEWRRGPLPPDLEQIWLDHGRSFASLAAIEYLLFERAVAVARPKLGAQMISLPYGALCADPIDFFKVVCDFSQLRWYYSFARRLRKFKLRNNDDKWRRNLTPAQQAIITDTLIRGGLDPETRKTFIEMVA